MSSREVRLATGRGRFVADLPPFHGELSLRVVRSPVAHARLEGVDASAALAVPGVVAVHTAEDLPDIRIPIRLPFASSPNAESVLQPPLARDVIRYVGEPVAFVLAESSAVAEDAAELVDLDLALLPASVSPLLAVAADAPVVHSVLDGNVLATVPISYGDTAAAFARADVIVRRRFTVHRHTAVPLETRGLVAEPDGETGKLTLWGAAKVKHFNRDVLARLLELDRQNLRLVEVDVGGGFGVRGELYPEDFLVPWAALRHGRAVRWIEDRAEHLVAANHARELVVDLAVAADADGTLLAFEGTAWIDQGAYVRTQGILPTLLPAMHLPGPYVWEAFALTSYGVLTHRTPVGTYRGPGMTEACFVRERALDLVAGELGLDPIDLRRRNLVPAARMPFVYDLGAESPPIVYESGDFPAVFERAVAALGPAEARRAGLGVGVAALVEMSAVGPFEEATVEARPDGTFLVRASVSSLGQGVGEALTRIASDELGVPADRVETSFADTDEAPEGFGSFASRSTVVAGSAVALAARELRRRAATLLEVEPSVVDLGLHCSELAELGAVPGRFEKEHPSYSFGAAGSAVAVDRETGRVEVRHHVVAHDVGRVIDPDRIHGQLAGAAAQGIGGALYEELRFDEDGNPLAISFAEYVIPSAAELPTIQTIAVESHVAGNPLGAKGAGEAGIVGTPAAVANAVADALGAAGVAVDQLPLTPSRVREILRRD